MYIVLDDNKYEKEKFSREKTESVSCWEFAILERRVRGHHPRNGSVKQTSSFH